MPSRRSRVGMWKAVQTMPTRLRREGMPPFKSESYFSADTNWRLGCGVSITV